jgi:metallo-beta-lactamase class B
VRAAIALLVLLPTFAFAQQNEEDRRWNAPVEPFRIIGNIYYVGAAEVTSFLVTTREGHILIDGGFVETAPMIQANVAKLGFKVRDIRILLNTQAHYDHAGGLSAMRAASGALFMAMDREVPLLLRGGLGDPQFKDRFPYPAISADRTLKDGDLVSLGGTTLTARLTPGHTPGCTTWTTTVRERLRRYDVVFVCSASVPESYRLVGNEKYPDAAADYRRTFATLDTLAADVFLAAHGSMFDLLKKAERLRAGGGPNPFIDPAGYKAYVARARRAFETTLERQTPK